jgi:hypothetical protein
MKLEFTRASKDQLYRIFLRFFAGQTELAEQFSQSLPENEVTPPLLYLSCLCSSILLHACWVFPLDVNLRAADGGLILSCPGMFVRWQLSLAQLQGHLLECRTNPQEAIANVPKLLQSIKSIKARDMSIYNHLK